MKKGQQDTRLLRKRNQEVVYVREIVTEHTNRK